MINIKQPNLKTDDWIFSPVPNEDNIYVLNINSDDIYLISNKTSKIVTKLLSGLKLDEHEITSIVNFPFIEIEGQSSNSNMEELLGNHTDISFCIIDNVTDELELEAYADADAPNSLEEYSYRMT
jgi:hypothetical protein